MPKSPTPDRRPRARPAKPAPPNPESTPQDPVKKRQDALLDAAVEETFPASDPIAPKHIT